MLLVGIRPVSAGMASGTVRLIGWELPDYGFRVRLMAGHARWIDRMIERLVHERRVRKVMRNPGKRLMTGVTLAGSNEVIRSLANRGDTVMARRANA